MLFYNFEVLPGAYVACDALMSFDCHVVRLSCRSTVMSFDWKASRSDIPTVPVGFGVGRTFDMGGGHGFDAMIGPCYDATDGAARCQIRFQANWMFH